jgi:hypothetical protein
MPTIGVYARLRPVAKRAEEGIEMDPGGCSILVRNLEFTLDRIFDERASQEEVYEVVGRDRVAQVVKGFNVCLVAYGQTGSGKTHTMFGPEEVLTNWRGAPADQHGIALRAMSDLFEAAAADAYTITCSYVEVYNDTCIDLLAREKKALPLRELPSGTPFVAGLTEEEVASVDSALSALSRGTARRATAQMSMNARSSRSHAVFSLALRGSAGATDGSTTSGKLVLVDLAGMESSKKSSSVEGASSAGPRREEAKHINTSLYALGTVIERLSVASREGDGAILSHVPFRNSKLTRLLQECLHGNTAPAFIATLRAEPQNLEECMATLRFAQRAKAVPVVVRANVKAAPLDSEALQKELKAVTRELGEAKALIERLQREAHEVHGPRRPVAGTDASDDARESALLMGRLQLGQLAEKMAELIGQSSELSAPPPASEGAAASADVFAGRGGATTPSQAPRAIPTARTAQAKASAAQAQAVAASDATAAELLKAQKAIEEAKMQAETALRAERARAAKVVKAAQAEAAETLEKRTAEISKETREWREKAAAEAEKRNKAATKAAAAEAKAEEQAAAAVRERTRANAAEQRLLAEKARADAAEAAAKAADARAASADAERERLTAAAAKAEADAEAADDAAAFAAAVAAAAFQPTSAAPTAVIDPFPALPSPASSAAARRLQRSQERATRLPLPTTATPPDYCRVPQVAPTGGLNRPDLLHRQLGPSEAHHRWEPSPTPPPMTQSWEPTLFRGRPSAPASSRQTVTPRTAAVIEMSRREALALQQLGFIFPELPERKLREALERVDWNLDAAASELIERDIPRQAWDSLWG